MTLDDAIWLTGPQRSHTRFGETPLFREGLYRIAPETYAWMVPNGSWGETNIGLIDCGGRSVLIDTCWDLHYTREMLDAVSDITSRSPIDCVINTHADGDHCWGNQLFEDRRIIATDACIGQMHHQNPRAFKTLKSAGKLLSRLPLQGVAQFGHYMHTMFSPYEFGGVRITIPGEGFSNEKLLNVNGVDIQLIEVGPGHTKGDAIAYVPSRKVVFAGDILFVRATPVMWAGPVENIVSSLKRLLAFDAQVIVVGHGPIATRADVQAVLDYWEFLQDQLTLRRSRGMPPDAAAREIAQSAAFRALPFAHWDSPERIVTNAYTLYRHWGEPLPYRPGKLGELDVMKRQSSLAFALPDARPALMRHLN